MPATTKPLKLKIKLNDKRVLPGAVVVDTDYSGGEWHILLLSQKQFVPIKTPDVLEVEEVP
mgnify:CR=1 FL=1